MTISNSNTNDGVKLHLQESGELQKQWFIYVFDNIQKLSDKIESNALNSQKDKEELLKLLVDYRDKLTKLIQTSDLKSKKEIDKVKDYLDSVITLIKTQLVDIDSENLQLTHLLDKELSIVKNDLRDNIESSLKVHILKDEVRFEKLNIALEETLLAQTVLKTKLGVYIVIVSLIITTLVTTLAGGMLVFFKDVIVAYLGLGN